MKAVMLEVPQAMLDERRLLDLDGRDEMWDGVLHMVPPPKDAHQGLSTEFLLAVGALAKQRGLVPRLETGLYRTVEDFRVPDLLFRLVEQGSERGAEGAELVVEIRSPGDESYRKLPFYAALLVREVIVLHPGEPRAELFRLVDGELRPVCAGADGLHCEVLDLWLQVDASTLRLTWANGSVEL